MRKRNEEENTIHIAVFFWNFYIDVQPLFFLNSINVYAFFLSL